MYEVSITLISYIRTKKLLYSNNIFMSQFTRFLQDSFVTVTENDVWGEHRKFCIIECSECNNKRNVIQNTVHEVGFEDERYWNRTLFMCDGKDKHRYVIKCK
jgi:hypothetical protein